jgi:basic amino acid/polyamine antiporter, APA family
MGTVLSVPLLRCKMPQTPRTTRLPGGDTIPNVAFAICLLFLLAATKKNWIGGGIAVAVGAVIYVSRRRAPPVNAVS